MGATQSFSVLHMFSTVPGLGISQEFDLRSLERASISKFYWPDKVGAPPDAALAKRLCFSTSSVCARINKHPQPDVVIA